MSAKGIVRLSLILTAVVVLILLVLYTYPRNIVAGPVFVSSDNGGDVVSISCSLTKRNAIFKPTQITGKIVLNDVEYVDMSSLGYDYYKSNSFLENIQWKYQGFSYDLFVRSDLTGNQIHLLNDTITIQKLSKKEIVLCKSDDSEEKSALYTIPLRS